MNRVNGVYEKDFAVTMQIIANNSVLVFFNAATDPYTNDDAAAMLNQNQTTCNNLIGTANYDIGHVFGAGDTGGIAGLSVVCGTSKANGVTGNTSPVGDPFRYRLCGTRNGSPIWWKPHYGNCGGAPTSLKWSRVAVPPSWPMRAFAARSKMWRPTAKISSTGTTSRKWVILLTRLWQQLPCKNYHHQS